MGACEGGYEYHERRYTFLAYFFRRVESVTPCTRVLSKAGTLKFLFPGGLKSVTPAVRRVRRPGGLFGQVRRVVCPRVLLGKMARSSTPARAARLLYAAFLRHTGYHVYRRTAFSRPLNIPPKRIRKENADFLFKMQEWHVRPSRAPSTPNRFGPRTPHVHFVRFP